MQYACQNTRIMCKTAKIQTTIPFILSNGTPRPRLPDPLSTLPPKKKPLSNPRLSPLLPPPLSNPQLPT